MKRLEKTLTALLLLVFAINVFSPLCTLADGGKIEISSANDLVKFSKNCVLDSFSKGREAVLTCDIDLTGVHFSPIPIFGGSFDGQGHTVFGLTIKNAGSVQGLFRYIEEGGEIKNLNVKGEIAPSGSKNTVGGIAGRNYGLIQNCSFSGNVSGGEFVGGIAGVNENSAKIMSCSVSGSIQGETGAGGISGKNNGLIERCVNSAEVNNILIESAASVADIDIYSDINNLSVSGKEDSDEAAAAGVRFMDVGGIAGFSGGIVQGCTNEGEIGYPRVGYNVGGIVGRQSGYVSDCINSGAVYGRKDVGGIAGQAEPYIFLNSSEDILAQTERELNSLRGLVNSSLDDADSATERFKNSLEAISDYAEAAKDSTRSIADLTIDFADGNLDVINDFSVTVSGYIDRLLPLTDDISDALDCGTEAIGDVKNAADGLDITFPDMEECVGEITDALDELSGASADAKQGMTNLKKALRSFESAVVVKNKKEQKAALNDISAAIGAISLAREDRAAALERIKAALTDITAAGEIKDAIADIISCESQIVSSLKSMASGIAALASNTSIDFDEIQDAADYLDFMTTNLSSAFSELGRGLSGLSLAISDTREILSDFIDDTDEQLDNAMDSIGSALDKLEYASDSLTKAAESAGDILDDLSNEEPLEFITQGDEYREAGDALFSSIEKIGSELDNLRDAASDEEGRFTGNIRDIGDSFQAIMRLLIDELQSAGEEKDIDDYFRDASEEDLSSIKEGKVGVCKNYGRVEADYNAGGIIGTMAIDYSLDPEDDIEKPSSFNFVYETKAIVQDCVNYGSITGKKDCVGGIAGKMSLGTAVGCENYGDAESSGGDYVGGIAGQSVSSILSSYSKASFAGGSYVGGICGYASKIKNSYSIAQIDAEEYYGAIAGFADSENADISGNRYVDNGYGAVDNISYERRAEPIDYDTLKQTNGIPKEFISFSVIFTADDETVAVKSLEYNEPLNHIVQPKVPEKDGYYGVWEDYPEDNITGNHTIEAQYRQWLTIIESDEKNENGKLPLAFAEGEFTDKARLSASESDIEPPKKVGARVYRLILTGSDLPDDAEVPVRLLNAEGGKAEVWQYIDGSWQSVSASDNGKYVKLKMRGTEAVLCIQSSGGELKALPIIIIAAILLAGAVIAIITVKKKKSKIGSA